VRKLRARRRGTTVSVSWRRVAGAARYAAVIRGRRGTRAGRLVRGKTHSVKFQHVRIDERLTIRVRALSRLGRQGRVRTTTLAPGRRR
jgi:hypothetical protein